MMARSITGLYLTTVTNVSEASSSTVISLCFQFTINATFLEKEAFNKQILNSKCLQQTVGSAISYTAEELISPYARRLLSVELTELGNSTLCRHPLEASKFNWGREMAFLIIGEMSGGGEDMSREHPRGRATEFFRTL